MNSEYEREIRKMTTCDQIKEHEIALKNFDAFGRLKALESGVDPIIVDAQRRSILSRLEDLRAEYREMIG